MDLTVILPPMHALHLAVPWRLHHSSFHIHNPCRQALSHFRSFKICHLFSTMPENRSVKAALALIEDPTKILGMTVGPHADVKPGQYIPKAGTLNPLPRQTLIQN